MFRRRMIEISIKRWVEKYHSMGAEKFYQTLTQYALTRILEEEEYRKVQAEKKISSNLIEVQKQVSSVSSGGKTVSFSSKKSSKPEPTKVSPEAELLYYSDYFSKLYRKEKIELFRDIAFCFKRAANKTYRIMVSKKLINKNSKFLNVVK